jgi:quinol monooxygenase YgiN
MIEDLAGRTTISSLPTLPRRPILKSAAVMVFATFEPQADTAEEVAQILRAMVGPTRAEPGNEIYDLYSSGAEGGLRFHLFERYVDDAALQTHRATDHYRAYRTAIGDLLASPIDVLLMTGHDVA